jgi:hypothetical protein
MLLAVAILTSGKSANKDVTLGALVLVAWPVLVVGKINLIRWSLVQNVLLTTESWMEFLLFIGVPLCARLYASHSLTADTHGKRDQRVPFLFHFLGFLVVLGSSHSLFKEGGGYWVGYMLSALVIFDLVSYSISKMQLPRFVEMHNR